MSLRPTILSPRELTPFLSASLPRVPVLLWGPPGAGKTALVRQLAARREAPLLAVHLEDLTALRDPPCLEGLDAVPSFQAPRMTARSRPVVVLVTGLEGAGAAGARARALATLLADGRLGRLRLPEGSLVVAEGRACGEDLPRLGEDLAGVLVQVRLEPSAEDWLEWAVTAGLPASVRAHIEAYPGHLADLAEARGPVSSPRAWHRLATLLEDPALAGDPALVAAATRGLVSPLHAAAFLDRAGRPGRQAAGTLASWPTNPRTPKPREDPASTSSASRRRTGASGSTG